jgi:hypothetical protein
MSALCLIEQMFDAAVSSYGIECWELRESEGAFLRALNDSNG